jgi:hypothetical protein
MVAGLAEFRKNMVNFEKASFNTILKGEDKCP